MKQTKMDKLNNHPTLIDNDQIDDYLTVHGLSDNPDLETATIALKVIRQGYLNKEAAIKERLEELDFVEKDFEEALDRFHNLVEEHKIDPDDVISMYDIPEILDRMSLTRDLYIATDIVAQILEDAVPDAVELPSMKLSSQTLERDLHKTADLLLLLKWKGESTGYVNDIHFTDKDELFMYLYGHLDDETIIFSKRQNDILDKYGID
jgi:hypothetical protein